MQTPLRGYSKTGHLRETTGPAAGNLPVAGLGATNARNLEWISQGTLIAPNENLVTAVTPRRDAGHSQTFGLVLDYDVLFCRDGTMRGERQNKHRTRTRAARMLAAAGVILSLLSIQQVWAEAFCACDHQEPSSSTSAHCSKHAAQHEHCEGAHVVATHEHATQTENNEDADSVATHQHAAHHEYAEETHSAAIQDHAARASGHHASRVSAPAPVPHAARYTEPSGSSAAVRFEGATNPSEGDGSGAPAKLICCHTMPTANLPASSAAVYSADVATDSTPVVFEIGAARAVIASTLLHPPRTRPIYLAVSSLLI